MGMMMAPPSAGCEEESVHSLSTVPGPWWMTWGVQLLLGFLQPHATDPPFKFPAGWRAQGVGRHGLVSLGLDS